MKQDGLGKFLIEFLKAKPVGIPQRSRVCLLESLPVREPWLRYMENLGRIQWIAEKNRKTI
jgi:hypothetical protein